MKVRHKGKKDIGGYTISPIPSHKLVLLDALDVLARSRSMTAMIEVDITGTRGDIRRAIRKGKEISLHAFLIYAVARTLVEYKELNGVICRGRFYRFKDIDINIPAQLTTASGESIPRQIVIRKADTLDPEGIYRIIEESKTKNRETGFTGKEDRAALLLMKATALLPAPVRRFAVRFVASRPLLQKRYYGTIHMSTVLGPAAMRGFVLPPLICERGVDITLGGI